MIGAGGFRRQQQKDQIHGLLVDGLEVDRRSQSREQAVEAVQIRQLAVGNGDADADTGGSQPFALEKRVEDCPLVKTGEFRGMARKLLQRLLVRDRRQGCVGNVAIVNGA